MEYYIDWTLSEKDKPKSHFEDLCIYYAKDSNDIIDWPGVAKKIYIDNWNLLEKIPVRKRIEILKKIENYDEFIEFYERFKLNFYNFAKGNQNNQSFWFAYFDLYISVLKWLGDMNCEKNITILRHLENQKNIITNEDLVKEKSDYTREIWENQKRISLEDKICFIKYSDNYEDLNAFYERFKPALSAYIWELNEQWKRYKWIELLDSFIEKFKEFQNDKETSNVKKLLINFIIDYLDSLK